MFKSSGLISRSDCHGWACHRGTQKQAESTNWQPIWQVLKRARDVALSVLIGLALSTTSTFGAESIGKVDGILDGDTFVVLHINRAERSRLNGIDCPEKDQA